MTDKTDDEFFNIQTQEDIKLMTKKDVANFLNVSVKMIDRKVHMDEIPFKKIGGRLVRFSKKEILAWTEGTTV